MNQLAILARPETSALDIFNFEGHDVRTVSIHGDAWFVANDISKSLDYASSKDMTRILDEDEKGRHIVPTPGGDQQMLVINESGLYSAILRSRKPEAKRFKKWVTSVLIPGIRKKEFVHVSEVQARPLGMEFILRELADLKNMVVSLSRQDRSAAPLSIAAPVQPAAVPGQLSTLEIKDRGLLTAAKIAHKIGITTSRLNAILEVLGFHERKANRYTPTFKGLRSSVKIGTSESSGHPRYLWKPELVDLVPKKYHK